MNILSYNPGHDGAITYLKDGHLVVSVEAEKNSNFRYVPISSHDVFDALCEFDEVPNVLCTGGWWPEEGLPRSRPVAGYRGILRTDIIQDQRKFLRKPIHYFSSSHERSHLLCAFGMSRFPKGTPCYALVWEGSIGAFYEIDEQLNITLLGDVMSEPGHRYALLYGLADPTFDKNGRFARHSDAGKLMALASYGTRTTPTKAEEAIIDFLLQNCPHLEPRSCTTLKQSGYYNVGVEDPQFRNLAGIFNDRLFDTFYKFARSRMKKGMPLLIAGGCGLNCDWNTRWRESGLFAEVFVPPVANDSGSAIGTAIDAQFHLTGNPKIDWSVYSGQCFKTSSLDCALYDTYGEDYGLFADMLADGLIFGWVSGKCEIGPRALGNRSILAAPFEASTRVRLNDIKQREQFRPIAPVCLEEDAKTWFGCSEPSPFMLYTQRVTTNALAAVTHVNGTARIQAVSIKTNERMYELLSAFKAITGFGVLCNTSLNFNGRGFINDLSDLSAYAVNHNLDGFVVEGRGYFLKCSSRYQSYLRRRLGAPSTSSELRGADSVVSLPT